MPDRVTLSQVAEAVGVSVMTVSNVLNGRPGAAEATRERVLAVAAQLGYTPSSAARNAKGGLTGMIGVLTLDLTNQYALEIVRGIADTLAESEQEVLISASFQDSSREYERVEFLTRGVVDGLILVAPALEERTLALLRSRGRPFVVVDPRVLETPVPRIIVDNYDGARAATQHLIDLGHKHIAFLAGDPAFESSRVRQSGFEDAMLLAGLEVEPHLIAETGFLYGTALQDASRILRDHRPTAVFAGADIVAFATVDAGRALGLDVPGDLSVVGFDDLPRSAHSFPGLTTVAQPLHDMGRLAARIVTAQAVGEPFLLERIQLPTELIVRGTTGAPGSRR